MLILGIKEGHISTNIVFTTLLVYLESALVTK